ncbi:MAG: hypothetical protein CMF12_08340 [Idiomarina sp.]|uniref:hypothetical protein n=1 Tax=Idiomarina sp. TaxID=1874361 RepID=UPI000C65E9EC|nr:hypothetical protein [Idiomarina sp.]MBT42517.1 hypothetical protein [Idiomarina sp.]
MKSYNYLLMAAVSLFGLSACSDGPGELEGKWQIDNAIFKSTVIYRDGEEETMGIISPVSYRHEGNDVYVTYESGLMEGHTIRYTQVNTDEFQFEGGTLKRIE